ncbi:hypothetical protein JT359_17805, partial [Candidatus Poribacteria bacterium]|nr:hypothetical protein [Candidatus Poribacteria bacterium]
ILLSCFQFSCTSLFDESVLYNILRKFEFRVTRISAQYPSKLQNYDLLFLQELSETLSDEEIQRIHAFVNDGGTLMVNGGSHKTMAGLVTSYGLKLQNLPNRMKYANRYSEQPYFPNNPVGRIFPQAYFAVQSDQRDMVNLYGLENQAVLATIQDGLGRVYFSTSENLFNENGLRHAGNATLFYNIMSTLPKKGHIGLAEEYYYSQGDTSPNSMLYMIFKTSWGLAAVYICIISFVFITLRGRRFGKPLDERAQNRRLSTEYVYAMTTLYQKGNTTRFVLAHIRDKFKADLGNRWHVNPNLDADSFLNEMINHGLNDEEAILSNIIHDLNQNDNITEKELVDLAKRVDTYHATTKLRRK